MESVCDVCRAKDVLNGSRTVVGADLHDQPSLVAVPCPGTCRTVSAPVRRGGETPAARGRARFPASHILLDKDFSLDSARKLLEDRLQQAQVTVDPKNLLDALEKNSADFNIDKKDLDFLRNSPSLNDPNFQRILKEIRALPPDKLNRLKAQVPPRWQELLKKAPLENSGTLPGGEVLEGSSLPSIPPGFQSSTDTRPRA